MAKKTTRKKASKKPVRKTARKKKVNRGTQRPRSAALSTAELQAELNRRERTLASLIKKRERAAARLAEIDQEIAKLGGSPTGGARPRNHQPLADALAECLNCKTLSVTEVAEVVQQAGYRTTSPNFRTIVNQTLIADKRFKRVGRGLYTVK